MTEYDPHDDEHEDLTPPVDVPDHADDPRFEPQHLPPLDDLGHADATPPPELHFPGDDLTAGDPADLDPAAPWPDDDHFSQWLAGAEPGTDAGDPAADAELREQLAEQPQGLPSSDELVDWALRKLDER
ncbi:MAG TPA: hypothetical protein VMY78_13760 [Solirubrobacteraceae bacterium]|nr:hypothetical protein [Solirubrobacteraceae bacterium]